MNLRKTSEKILCRIILERPLTQEERDLRECEGLLRREATDWLYYLLGASTYIYLALLAVMFFGGLSSQWPRTWLLVDGLQNPYLGALGIYVILKEVRKRRRKYPSRYLGELFVVLWLALLSATTIAVLVSPQYGFDEVYNLILNNSLVIGLIYLGAFIHNP